MLKNVVLFLYLDVDNMTEKENAQRDRDAILRHMTKQVLEPIKSMVINGAIDIETATALVHSSSSGGYRDKPDPEYGRFRENSGKLFENEIYFESGYETPGGRFVYKNPSHVDSHFLFQLYNHLNGPNYETPEELREAMGALLKDKRFLELGCGPGFGLALFQELGANATGVEIRTDYRDAVPGVDIRYGDAVNLKELYPDEEFDIIYSNDFFADVCIDDLGARKVAYAMHDVTADCGIGFHTLSYKRMSPIMLAFRNFAISFMSDKDPEKSERFWDNLSDDEREELSWTNTCSLDPQFLIRAGFDIEKYGIENLDLVIVTRK